MQIEVANHQKNVRFSLPCLREVFRRALPLCAASPAGGEDRLSALDVLQVSILSDSAIARVHAQYFDDPSPTDVITFPYGEILLGAETVAANAAEHGVSADREAALCLIHGMLHLRGYGDAEPAARDAMHRRQQEILDAVVASRDERRSAALAKL